MKHLTVYDNGKERGMQSYLHALFKAFFGSVSLRVISLAEVEEKAPDTATDGEKEEAGRSSRGRQRKVREQQEDGDRKIFWIGQDHEKLLFCALDPAAIKQLGYEESEKKSEESSEEAILQQADSTAIASAANFVNRAKPDLMVNPSMQEAIKNFAYESLCSYTGHQLPWGSLMGVRPTKLARTRLEALLPAEKERGEDALPITEEDRQSIIEFYKTRYFVSREKAKVAVDIAGRELSLIRKLHPEKGYSLYVGVPFCPTRCLYCSFVSDAVGSCRDLVEPCLEATIREIRASARIMEGKVLDTVYIGGGTPTALSADQLQRLMGAITESFDLSGVLEYTVEAGRADSITKEKLEVIRQGGANRISVNPQTMNEETLRLIGRAATTEQVKEAFALAREEGFSHINMDLILGLPGEDTEMVQRTLKEVQKLGPDSMTVHSLAIKRGSDLHRIMTEKGVDLNWDTRQALALAYEAAESMKLLPYYLYRQKNMTGNLENVGFARDGKFGIYNILIMEEVQSVIACGAGTISKKVSEGKIERSDNPRDVRLYIDTIEELIRKKEQMFLQL